MKGLKLMYSIRRQRWPCMIRRNLCVLKSGIKDNHEARAQKIVNSLSSVETSRASLAAAITLVETENRQKKKIADNVLNLIMKKSSTPSSYRIGISGPPGAGKSSFIEVFGKFLTSLGHKVAVLAVDPSSSSTGGSLLGDKTRMAELTRDPNAYIRPSPTRGCLGGVTRSTNEAIVLCEFAGYDIIIVETTGVGQSEYSVANMVDIFVLLLPPGGGDELQGIKRGIVEKADLLVVTKADGDLIPAAHRTQYEYSAAIKFMRPNNSKWKTKVIPVSSKMKIGIDKYWEEICNYRKVTQDDFIKKRGEQRAIWMWAHVQEGLERILLMDSRLKELTTSLLNNVREGTMTPGFASDKILSLFKISNDSTTQ